MNKALDSKRIVFDDKPISRLEAWWIESKLVDQLLRPICFCRRQYRSIKRLIAWFPIIWDDRDWDATYLYEIMRFKISRMRKEIGKNDRHTCVNRNVRNMRIAEILLKRASFSDFYQENDKLYKPLCECEENHVDKWADGHYRSPFCDHCKKYHLKKRDRKQKTDFEYAMDLIKNESARWWD